MTDSARATAKIALVLADVDGTLLTSENRQRDWRRIHHSPLFWLGVVPCLAAIMIYVLSDDLSWRSHPR
jgi:hypothetical protein